MKIKLTKEEQGKLRAVGLSNIGKHVEVEQSVFNKNYAEWKKTLPLAGHSTLTLKAISTCLWTKRSGEHRKDFVLPQPKQEVKVQAKFPRWELRVIVGLLVLILGWLVFALPAKAQFSQLIYIEWKDGGSAVNNGFFTYGFTVDCTTNLTCTSDGATLTMSAAAGSGGRWDQLTAPTGAMSLVSNADAEIMTWDFQSDFSTDRFVLKQTTGNPTGGALLLVTAADTDVLLAQFGSSTGAHITQAGLLGIGTASPSTPLEIAATTSSMKQTRWVNTGPSGAGIVIQRSRGSTIGDDTIVQDGDHLAALNFRGYDGNDFTSQAARISAFVDGTPGLDDMPGRLAFYTTADGANSATERMRIDSSGNVGIGTATPTHTLDVAGEQRIAHVAGGAADHALEISNDSAGFGDVKAIDIFYDTGAISAGEDEGVILINIDESDSTGGSVVGLEVLSTTGSAKVYGTEFGVGVNPIIQLSGAFGDMDSALVLAVDSLTAFTTSDPAGANNVDMFVADDDTITIGDAAKYEEVEFLLEVVSSVSIQPTFEYSTGVGTWATFTPTDGTGGMRNSGVVAWLVGDIPGWVVGTGTEFLIRITRTRNNISTVPTEDLVQIVAGIEYMWDSDGNINVLSLQSGSGAEIADAGFIRCANAEACVAWELATPGTDKTLIVDSSDILQFNGTLNATVLTESTNAVPNATDGLDFFAATTVAELAGVLSDEDFTPGSESSAEGVLDLPDLQGQVAAGQYAAASIDGDDLLGSSIGGVGLTLTAASPDTLDCDAASTSAVGCPEMAIASEVNTGTSTILAVTPDALAGSTFGQVEVQMVAFDFTTAVATGDGKFYFHIATGSKLIGMNLIDVVGAVITVSSSGAITVDVARCAPVATGNPCSGTVADALSTNLTIDQNEDSSDTAATDAVIDTSLDDVVVDQMWRVDVDGAGTGTQGLIVTLIFQLP